MSRTSWKVMMITPFRLSALLVLLCLTGFPVGEKQFAAAEDGTQDYIIRGDGDLVDNGYGGDPGVFSGVNTFSRSLVRQLPVDRGWTYNSPIDKSIKNMFQSSKLRLEYLHWSIEGPDNVLLSSPILGVPDPTQPTTVFDRETGVPRGNGVALQYNDRSMDTNGMRGVLEFALPEGSLEWNVWGLFKNESNRPTDSIYALQNNADPDDDLSVVVNFKKDGVLAANTNVFDVNYTVNMNTEMVGTGVNYILDPFLPGDGFHMQPLFGFRVISLRERLSQVGIDSGDGLAVGRTSVIESKVENRVFGPSIGARAEYKNSRFSIGAEPKFTFGFNRNTNQVATEQLFVATDPRIVTVDKNNEFSPTFQLSVYAKLNVNEHLRCFVGYDFLFIGQISRAYNVIDYNESPTSGEEATGTRVRQDNSDFTADGITAGIELVW
ncbi:MAG: BBP7 family outer membrane beta-barrel protein [Planctomycetes bacterium]|nr:BBP7 family outer membrane beta-barrel protein [Planctomycetota bacterium]MCH9727876.1 BBP7 family outer membrane beta-barrel protein [Planctomycetota bacterium]MCH9775456.1 BBP7 family outer membrane beta-barrel protein [Planctomycetota bacterium]MCH9792154.1 BBP7 family outer membrane beta-barrel protein [Planctomycetota bacterium]MDF1743527.1 BBP7 family outer membrane beta-barrel protein [Gimesia sp.]